MVAVDEITNDIVTLWGRRIPLEAAASEPRGEGWSGRCPIAAELAADRGRCPRGRLHFGSVAPDFVATGMMNSAAQRPVRELDLAEGMPMPPVYDLSGQLWHDRGFGEKWPAAMTRHPLHACVGGEDHRRAAAGDHPGRARVRRYRGEDQRPLDGHPWGRPQPLVPHGHELPRHHRPARYVRLRWSVGRWLGSLCRPGKAAAPNRLATACLCLGLRSRGR